MPTPTLLIDNLAFAKKDEHLTGQLTLTDCIRLEELVQQLAKNTHSKSASSGKICYDLHGNTNALGQQTLSLSISASLLTTCQRCLEDMQVNLSLNFNYLISELKDDDLEHTYDNMDDYDLIEPNPFMDVIALIEDELIMALPIAPTHDTHCQPVAMQSGEKLNPFAELKGLLKK